jgi:hypothetical protein
VIKILIKLRHWHYMILIRQTTLKYALYTCTKGHFIQLFTFQKL